MKSPNFIITSIFTSQPLFEKGRAFSTYDRVAFRRGAECDFYPTFRKRIHLIDGFYADDELPVDPEETLGVEQFFQPIQILVHRVGLIVTRPEVIDLVFRKKIHDLVHIDRFDLIAESDEEPPFEFPDGRVRLQLPNQLTQIREHNGRLGLVELFQGARKFFPLNRFEQIVNAVHAKRVKRVLIVGGREDDWSVHLGLTEYLKAETVGELNVKKDQVRCRMRA